jgi:hypothetical protein
VTDQSPKTQGVDTIEAVLHTTQAGATLPAARALFFSLMVGFLALVTCLVVDQIRPYWWRAALLGMAISMVVSWMIDEKRRGRLFDALERRLNFDMDGDGDIGGVPTDETININLMRQNDNGGWEGKYSKLPVKRDQAVAFAYRVIEFGESTAVRTWTSGQYNVFSRDEYDAFVDWLDDQGGVTWKSDKDHRVGWTLNEDGVKILRTLL